MKRMLMALCLLTILPMEALAISRYNSTSMSCPQIRATLRAEGAAILRWRSQSGIQRYNRFVASDRFCPSAERAERTTVPAAGGRSCAVLECRQYSEDDDFFWLRRR